MRTVLGLRGRLGLVLSGALVLLIGGLGLLAGAVSEHQANAVHRAERLQLQQRLAGLVDQYAQNAALEVLDHLDGAAPWSARTDDPKTVVRLQQLVERTRALDAAAVLVDATGRPLAAWSATGELPSRDDPGWRPLRAVVRAGAGRGVVPLSAVMRAGDAHVVALGVPVVLEAGGTGLLLGLWDAARSPLQRYVSGLTYGKTGRGYVLDPAGTVLAGPSAATIGAPLPMPELRAALAVAGPEGILQTADDGTQMVTAHATGGATGWTVMSPQTRAEFEGGLVRSGRLEHAAVVTLLLVAGTSLVLLHRRRESALQEVALHDELTGLCNRRGWFLLAAHELEHARRLGSGRVLLFVDVDGLKQVNDQLGHRQGDRALADTAAVLRAASRASDVVGRLGGDEFVLLVTDDHLDEDGERARARLAAALQEHVQASAAGFELRMSVGAACWSPEDPCSLEELVARADAQMYAHKQRRTGRHDGLLRLPAPRPGDEGRSAAVSRAAGRRPGSGPAER